MPRRKGQNSQTSSQLPNTLPRNGGKMDVRRIPICSNALHRTSSRPDAAGDVSRLGFVERVKFPRCLTVWSLLGPISCSDIIQLSSFRMSFPFISSSSYLVCLLSSTFIRFLHVLFSSSIYYSITSRPSPTGISQSFPSNLIATDNLIV